MLRRISIVVALVAALARPALVHAGGWPGLVQYQQALRQHGATVFGDPALRTGTLKRTGPNIFTNPGGTSAVFHVTDRAGKAWAVRCFTRQPPHDRHEAIARAISESGLSEGGAGLFPEVEYVKEGIQMTVAGKTAWYPIVKMSWVTGKKLDAHIDQLITAGRHEQLEQLAEDWRAVHGQLRAKGIAHGDLQHGNVLVKPDGKLHLIDFDDLFIERFRGEESGGSGHPAFSHPARGGGDFYLDVDNFSSLVIYVSLKALAHDPGLWKDGKIHIADGNGGGDNLIFQRADFEDPADSRVFDKLAKSSSAEVRKLAAQLADYASTKHLSEVPPLETLLAKKAWKPDGTIPDDFERAEPQETASEPEHEAAPKRVHPVAEKILDQPSDRPPGPNATPAEWQLYRLNQLKRR